MTESITKNVDKIVEELLYKWIHAVINKIINKNCLINSLFSQTCIIGVSILINISNNIIMHAYICVIIFIKRDISYIFIYLFKFIVTNIYEKAKLCYILWTIFSSFS